MENEFYGFSGNFRKKVKKKLTTDLSTCFSSFCCSNFGCNCNSVDDSIHHFHCRRLNPRALRFPDLLHSNRSHLLHNHWYSEWKFCVKPQDELCGSYTAGMKFQWAFQIWSWSTVTATKSSRTINAKLDWRKNWIPQPFSIHLSRLLIVLYWNYTRLRYADVFSEDFYRLHFDYFWWFYEFLGDTPVQPFLWCSLFQFCSL